MRGMGHNRVLLEEGQDEMAPGTATGCSSIPGGPGAELGASNRSGPVCKGCQGLPMSLLAYPAEQMLMFSEPQRCSLPLLTSSRAQLVAVSHGHAAASSRLLGRPLLLAHKLHEVMPNGVLLQLIHN